MIISGSKKAVIYAGFFLGSTEILVRVQDVDIGQTVYLFDEDSLTEIGSQIAASEDVTITISPLSARRIIAFLDSFGSGTAGGVDVLVTNNILTGWLTPEPVDAESVPEEIGLWNPGALNPLTARYDPTLINSIPAAYRARALELVAEPITFDITIIYRVEAPNTKMAVVSISSVKNARGTFVAVIDGTTANSKNILVDKTFSVTVTDADGRVATKSVTVNPITGFYPVPPTPPASAIVEYKTSADYGQGAYYVRADARADAPNKPMQVSFNNGTTWLDMYGSPGGTQWGYLQNNVLPVMTTIIMRIKDDPTDYITRVIPVPYP